MSESPGVTTSGVSQPTEERRASDGALYTYAQFASHYGQGADWFWESAEQQTASEVSEGSQMPQQPAVTPTAPTATSHASDGAHLVGDCEPPSPSSTTLARPWLCPSRGHGRGRAVAVAVALSQHVMLHLPTQKREGPTCSQHILLNQIIYITVAIFRKRCLKSIQRSVWLCSFNVGSQLQRLF